MTFLISYDLKGQNRNYEAIISKIKTADHWCHYLESTWIIESSRDLSYWTHELTQIVDSDDNFIVIEIKEGSINGWLPKKAWEWIKSNCHGLS